MTEALWDGTLFLLKDSRSFAAWDTSLRVYLKHAEMRVLEHITGEARRPRRPRGKHIFRLDGEHTIIPVTAAARNAYVLWHVKDEQAKRTILYSVARHCMGFIATKRTAKQMYDELVRRFGGRRQLSCRLPLCFYTWTELMYDPLQGSGVDGFVKLWMGGVFACQEEGVWVPEPVKVAIFIRMFSRVAPEWAKTMREVNVDWEGVSVNMLTWEETLDMLKTEVERSDVARRQVLRGEAPGGEVPEREEPERRELETELPERGKSESEVPKSELSDVD